MCLALPRQRIFDSQTLRLQHAITFLIRWLEPGILRTATTVEYRHSRAGGNPKVPASQMDSRFRGNDGTESVTCDRVQYK